MGRHYGYSGGGRERSLCLLKQLLTARITFWGRWAPNCETARWTRSAIG